MNEPKAGISGKTRIVVVDDHPLLREALIQLINRQADMVVVGFADSVKGANAAVFGCAPDLLVLDLRLEGGGDAIEFIKSVREHHPETRTLVLSQYDEMVFAERCLRAGAAGYITKQEASSEIITAIRAVLGGETYLSRKVAVLVFHHAVHGAEEPGKDPRRTRIAALTDRQLFVFQLLGAGLTNREIAKEMNLSVKTVETHREQIKSKLGARNAADLACMAKEWAQAIPTAGT